MSNLYAAYDRNKNYLASGTVSELEKMLKRNGATIKDYIERTKNNEKTPVYIYQIPHIVQFELEHAVKINDKYKELKERKFNLLNALQIETTYILSNEKKYNNCSRICEIADALKTINEKIATLKCKLDYLCVLSERDYNEFSKRGVKSD